jgi:uncharacterized membrane protein HdeD (DUF308 family)
MANAISKSWWMFALRGAIAVLFGVLAIAWPGLTLLWLVALFAAFALIGGGVSVVAAARNRGADDYWWLALLLGLVSIGAGIVAIFHPGLTALVLVLLMGANAIVTGVLDIAMAARLRKAAFRGKALLILAGLVSLAFGVLVFLFPDAGALALVWLISFYAVLSGVLLIGAAVRARRAAREYDDDIQRGVPA